MYTTEDVYNSILEYYKELSYTGYKSYSYVFKLLIFDYIDRMMNGPMAEFITEDDYKQISKYLESITDGCFIPYEKFKEGVEPVVKRFIEPLRLTECMKLRKTENNILRIL